MNNTLTFVHFQMFSTWWFDKFYPQKEKCANLSNVWLFDFCGWLSTFFTTDDADAVAVAIDDDDDDDYDYGDRWTKKVFLFKRRNQNRRILLIVRFVFFIFFFFGRRLFLVILPEMDRNANRSCTVWQSTNNVVIINVTKSQF